MPLVTTNLFGQLTFLPYQAEAPLRERLEWKTDVIEARSGAEDRSCLRMRPRQSFEQKVPLSTPDRAAAAFNLIYGQHGSGWAIPVWSEAQTYTTSGASTILCDTTTRDLRASSLALLWKDEATWAVVEVNTITSSSLVLSAPTPFALSGSGWVIPLRKGRLQTPAQRDTSGYGADLSLLFEVDDNVELAVATPAQFLGDDIYFEETMLPSGGALGDDHLAKFERVDDEVGVVSNFNLWSRNRTRRDHFKVMTTPQEVWDFRLWLHRRAGKFRPYWQPTLLNDVRHRATGTVVSALSVWADDRLAGATARTHIAVRTFDGTWYARTISSVTTVSADQLTLNLDSALNIPAASIERISYLGLRRLDTDRVELSFEGGNCTSSVSTVELSP